MNLRHKANTTQPLQGHAMSCLDAFRLQLKNLAFLRLHRLDNVT